MRKKLLIGGFIALVSFMILVEVVGRWYGLCSYPLMVLDSDYEYAAAPNQSLTIFQHRFQTNEHSMRSKPLSSKDKIRLLLIGDSIIFGGNHTDQDSLVATLLEQRLSEEFGLQIRVLNIAAGSWGPDNAAAFLNKHGTFDAEMMVAVFSSHDALDFMTFENLENHPEMGTSQAPFAWAKIWTKWISPKIFGSPMDKSSLDHYPTGADLNPGFGQLASLSQSINIPFFLYLHAEKKELKDKTWNLKGRWIKEYVQTNHIPFTTDFETGISEAEYRDDIHLNDQGHRFLADQLYPLMKQRIEVLMQN